MILTVYLWQWKMYSFDYYSMLCSVSWHNDPWEDVI